MMKLLKPFLPAFVFVLTLWLIKIIEAGLSMSFTNYGLHPLELSFWYGIFTYPFLHGDFEHLYSNSIPLLVSMTGIFYFYRKIALDVILIIYVVSGFWLFLFGREGTVHVGASGLVYGFISFLFFMGVFRKERKALALALLLVFLYGSLLWGLFPLVERMSWEGHLSGFIAGLSLAIHYRKAYEKKPEFEWQREDYEDPFEGYEFLDLSEMPKDVAEGERISTFKYHYKPKEKGSDKKE